MRKLLTKAKNTDFGGAKPQFNCTQIIGYYL
jgi:hypothetical protein